MKQIIPGLWVFDEIGDRVQCYMWEWQQGLTLIDAGYARDGKLILQALIKNGFALHSVRRIIVTHADIAHSGGLPPIKAATQAKVLCHAVEKEYLEQPIRRRPASPMMLLPYLLANLLPGFRQRGVKPDELVVDGQVLPEGFMIVHTPGYTPGHISLLHRERRLLITGDALSNRLGQLQPPSSFYTPDSTNAQRSIWKLAKRYGDDFETIVFGHGPPIATNGGKRVKALASQIFATSV
jgi:glyoxylase-like metal-dependent hydrolase (beta-lactamase superfamily II)